MSAEDVKKITTRSFRKGLYKNDYVFDKFLAAFPTLDITYKNIKIKNGKFSIDIFLSDFDIHTPILRLMKDNTCVGVTFLLELQDGSKIPWTLMQVYAGAPHIWYPFEQKCLLCPKFAFLEIKDLKKAKEAAQEVMKEVAPIEDFSFDDLIPLLIFWKSQGKMRLLIKTLRQLVLGQSIYVIDSANLTQRLRARTLPPVIRASIAGSLRQEK